MNRILYILILFITGSCHTSVRLQSNSFDKEKWLTSSEYRCNIAKSEIFPDLKRKSKDDVKNILGEPDEVNGDIFIYCFDINPLKHYDQELKREVCNCKGSFVTIDFKIDERWRTTISWVESLPKK